jgi:uncharacterized membrane protein
MKSRITAVPTILLKVKRAAFWLWLGFVVCMILAGGFKQLGWELMASILSGGIWVFAIAFAACVVVTLVIIGAKLFRSVTSGRRDV